MSANTLRFWKRWTQSLRQGLLRRRPLRLSALEDRLAPATLYGLTETGNQLYLFDSATPGTVTTLNVTGLSGGETLLGIDFRPADLKLYGFSNVSSKVYAINTTTGAATLVGTPGIGTLSTNFGFDFNPTVDRIRVVGDAGNNLRLNPNDGSLTAIDSPLNGATSSLAGAAYTNNFAGTQSTKLYGIDANSDGLYLVTNPNAGTTTFVGALGVDTDGRVGFDIAFDDGVAYASLTVGGVSKLYTIDLTTGAATSLGTIGGGAVAISGLTAKYTTNVPPVVTVSGTAAKYDIETDAPVPVDTGVTVTDLDSPNFNGGSLLVTLAGGVAGDVLDLQNQGTGAGQVGTNAGKVFFGGVEVGFYLAGSDVLPLVVTFNASATPAAAQAVARAVTFATTDNSLVPPNRTATFEVNDGGATGTSKAQTVLLGDFTPPSVVSIVRNDADPTNATVVSFTVNFSENVSGVSLSDFSLNLTGTAAGTLDALTVIDGKTYTVSVKSVAGDGKLRLDLLDDDSITDGAGNPLGGTGTGNGDFTLGQAYTIDNTDPVGIITLDMGQTDPANAQPVVFLVNFSEPVTGFDQSDIVVGGTAPGAPVVVVTAIDASNYTVSVSGFTGDGTVEITFPANSAFDAAGNGSEASVAFGNSVTLVIENQGPVITAPATATGDEDTALVFSGPNLISISDADAGTNPIEVKLTATNGRLTLSGVTGLTFSDGDGTADTTMTFQGTLADINAALNGLTFDPDANFNGPATVTIFADDLGNTGLGGPQNDTAVIDVTINAVNDGPTITITGPFSTDEDVPFNFPAGSVVIADADAAGNPVEVTLSVTNGTLTLGTLTGLTFSVGDGTADASMKFQGTVADINAALDTLVFTPALNFNGSATLTVGVDDLGATGGGSKTATDTATISVNAVNDGPTISAPGSVTFNEDTTFLFNGANTISISDVDVGTGTLKVSLATTNGTLTMTELTGITFTTGDGTGDASMTFTGTLTNVNAAIATLRVTPAANFNGTASLTINVDDQGNSGSGGAKTADATVTLNVTAVNDAPTVVNSTFKTLQNIPITISAPGVLAGANDPEGSALTATLVTGVPAAAGTLTLQPNGGFNFVPATNFVGTVTFQFQASDGSQLSNVGTVTIEVGEFFTRLFATGAGAGGQPQVNVYDLDGTLRFAFDAFDPSFRGGVTVATGDVNGDGVEDIILGAGAGGGPHVRVVSGKDLQQIHSFYAFDPNFTGGVNVAAGDVNNDGVADVIVGAGAGGGPHVRVFDGKTGQVVQEFFAYDAAFTGGVNVAGGDLDGDGRADIVTGAGPGGGPHVIVYKGGSGQQILRSFYAFDEAFTGGVQVAVGAFNDEPTVFTAAGAGGVPIVNAFNFDTSKVAASFFAFASDNTGGVRIATQTLSNGRTTLYLAAGRDFAPSVRVLDANTLNDEQNFNAYDPAWLGGVFIG